MFRIWATIIWVFKMIYCLYDGIAEVHKSGNNTCRSILEPVLFSEKLTCSWPRSLLHCILGWMWEIRFWSFPFSSHRSLPICNCSSCHCHCRPYLRPLGEGAPASEFRSTFQASNPLLFIRFCLPEGWIVVFGLIVCRRSAGVYCFWPEISVCNDRKRDRIIIVIVIIIIQKKSFTSPQFVCYRHAEKANKFQKTDSRLTFHVGPIMEHFWWESRMEQNWQMMTVFRDQRPY